MTQKTPPDLYGETRSIARATGDDSGFALLVSSEAGVSVVTLDGRAFVLGRAPECDVSIPDGSVSRHHARLVIDDTMTLEDLGSTNGTAVHGQKLDPGGKVTVGLGSVFELGSATFVIQRARGLAATDQALSTTAGHALPSAPPPSSGDSGPIVADPTMRHLYALLDVIAPSPLSVLVLGETGVGKEVYAKAVHERSARRGAPFLQLNCAALPESILEGELFGYEKGAFTGAVHAKAGLFESADTGTVFLDEVGEIPMSTQAKLLRVLESGETMRLGALKPRVVDVRFIAATNRDLRQAIVDGRFRADLFFRLNGMTITLPPLRNRKADIGPLARFLANKSAEKLGRPQVKLAPAVIRSLERYAWPGNVRELRNVIERAVVMCPKETLGVEHLVLADPEAFGVPVEHDDETTTRYAPTSVSLAERGASATNPPLSPPVDSGHSNDLKSELREIERQRILDALNKCAGNQSQAAKMLGMSRYTLINRLEVYGIARPRKGR